MKDESKKTQVGIIVVAHADYGSAMLRSAMGDQVIDHYLRAAEWELEEQNRVVTDWELARGFERA